MKKILCFGDSNTYGYIPACGKRFDKDSRWPGILQKLCGSEIQIIEAGCNNRTAFCDNPDGVMQTGYKILPEFLKLKPDIVILFIGVNDLQFQYNPSAKEIEIGLTKIIEQIDTKNIFIIAPPLLDENVLKNYFAFQFDKTSVEKSSLMYEIFKTIAQQENCIFIDINQHVKVSSKDGLHFEQKDHQKIAELIYTTMLKYINYLP